MKVINIFLKRKKIFLIAKKILEFEKYKRNDDTL